MCGVRCNRPDLPDELELEILVKAQQPDVSHASEVFDICHREVLAHLEKLTSLVSRLQADVEQEGRSQVRELAAFFTGPAREHNHDEERHVFPTLLQHEDEEVRRAAETLCEDHAWIELTWLDIEPQLAAVADGVSTFDPLALRSAVEVFDAVMRDHIALEESLLYPQLRDRLGSELIRSIGRETAAREEASSHRTQPG